MTSTRATPAMESDTYRGPAPDSFQGIGLHAPTKVGRYEIADFPTTDDGSGQPGLTTKMRVEGSGSAWQDYNHAELAADRFLATGRGLLEQDVWWTDKEGITLLVDNLSADRRRFIARMLTDRAAAMHARYSANKQESNYWSFVAWADEHDCGVWEQPPSGKQILDTVRDEQSDGEHLTWMRSTPLFQRMVRDLEWTHPGVTGTVLDLGHPDRPAPTEIHWSDLPEDF